MRVKLFITFNLKRADIFAVAMLLNTAAQICAIVMRGKNRLQCLATADQHARLENEHSGARECSRKMAA